MASILTTVRDLDRLRQIAFVLAKHGFGQVLERVGLDSLLKGRSEPQLKAGVPRAARLRMVFEELGPSFVKLGQIISTRPDVIPADIVEELKKLQDQVPPIPFEELEPHVERELSGPIADHFIRFDRTPLASASIAQVHRATIAQGEKQVEVVVKVQKPGIAATITRDVDLLYFLARAIERSIPESRTYSPVGLVTEFDRAISAELDFLEEADHANRFREAFAGDETVIFPEPFRSHTTKRLLTLSFIDGRKLYDAVAGGASGKIIAKTAVRVIVKQVFEDGFFHADPHPGNLLIVGPNEAPILAMIDVGLVGRLSPKMRDRVVEVMVGAVRRDHRMIADALLGIGRATRKIDRAAFEAEVVRLSDRYLGKALGEIQFSHLIRDLVSGAIQFGLEIPSEFLMYAKTLMTVEGIGREIDPELDLLEEVRPYFLELLKKRYSPERLTQDAMYAAVRLASAANDMPLHMQEILDDLRKGTLKLGVESAELPRGADQLGRRIAGALMISALILSSALALHAGHIGYALLYVGAGGALYALNTFAVAWFGRRKS